MAPRKPSIQYRINSNSPFWHMSFTHIEQSVGAVNRDVWCIKFPSSFLNTVFASFSVASSPRSFLLTSATGQIGVHTALLSMPQNRTDMWLSTFEIRAAPSSFALSKKSRYHNLFCVWAEALSGMIFVAVKSISCIVPTQPQIAKPGVLGNLTILLIPTYR